MQYVRLWLACACAAVLFALAGCPGQRKPQLILPKQPDQYDQWAQGLQQEDAFYAELARLQRLYTDAPDLALAAPKAFDGEYTLKSRIEQQRAGLALTDRKTGEQWTLWFFDNTGEDAPQLKELRPPKPNIAKQNADSGAAAPKYASKSDPDANPPVPYIAPMIEVMRDEASASGYTLELSLDGGAVSMSVVARWVKGRYLQCTRELTLSGLDQAQQADPSQTAWTLDGAWLPYRMAPGLTGPYGVVPDAEADGAWHGRLYPVEAMVPAIAAYDRTHGFMLAVSDDHPRKLDRRYDLAYAIPKGLAPGAQIRCTYTTYDGTRDVFDRPWLASSLPIRDSVVLEPLKLVSKSADPTLVEAESAEVVQHVADFVHAYHFVPKPPALPEPGAIVRAGQLRTLASRLGQKDTLEDGITQAAGPCGAKLCLLNPYVTAGDDAAKPNAGASQAAPPPLAGVGIDATGLGRGKELGPEQLQFIQQLKQGGLTVLAQSNLQEYDYDRHAKDGFPNLQPDWFMDISGWVLADRLASLKAGNDCGWPGAVQPNWRDAQAKAWFTRKLCSDLARYPDIAGYALRMPLPVLYDRPEDSKLTTPMTGCFEAQNALFQLHLGEALRLVRADAVLLSDAEPNLAMPAWCGVLEPNNCWPRSRVQFDYRRMQVDLPKGYDPSTQRLSTFLINRVFATQPYVSTEPNDASPSYELARAVMGTAGTPNGILLDPEAGVVAVSGASPAAGFPAFATHQIELQAASGELRVVYSDPAKNAYTGGDERPAVCEKLIAILPGNWTGAQSVWVCFSGIGGSMRIDKYNYLSISWEGGGWTGKLPTGYWEITHPSKGARIEPGDAVLIMLKPISPMFTPGKPVG